VKPETLINGWVEHYGCEERKMIEAIDIVVDGVVESDIGLRVFDMNHESDCINTSNKADYPRTTPKQLYVTDIDFFRGTYACLHKRSSHSFTEYLLTLLSRVFSSVMPEPFTDPVMVLLRNCE
jgi:hypothetical protein